MWASTQCKDGFVMLLEFTTGRKLFFWSQEPRKKGLSWDKEEDTAKERELMSKANDVLNGKTPAPAAAAPAGGWGVSSLLNSGLRTLQTVQDLQKNVEKSFDQAPPARSSKRS